MTDDVKYETFLSGDDQQRSALLLDEANAEYFSRRLGEKPFIHLKKLAEQTKQRFNAKHLASQKNANTIFVPGVMGSILLGKIGAGVWWIDALRGREKINRLGLNPDGGDPIDERLHVEARGLDTSYEDFLFAAYDQQGICVEKHPYDWRKSLRVTCAGLADHIERIWQANGNKRVNLVAHSMGGMLVRAALLIHGARITEKIGKIVFIATPQYGSCSIAYYLREHIRGTWEMWALGKYLDRATFRSLWGPLELLPAPRGIYPGTRDNVSHQCTNIDMYKAAEWGLHLTPAEELKLQKILDNSKAFYDQLFTHHAQLGGLRKRMLVIAGVGVETIYRVNVVPGVISGTRTEIVKDSVQGNLHRQGDGSVIVASAKLEDVEIRYVKGEHQSLPSMPEVYQDVFRFLLDEPLQLSTSMQAALQGHLAPGSGDAIRPAAPGHDDKFNLNQRWSIDAPTDEEWEWLESLLDEGRLPHLERARLL